MQKCSALTCIKISEAEMKYSIFPTIFFKMCIRDRDVIELAAERPKPEFDFKLGRIPGKYIFETKDLVIGYDEPLSKPLNICLLYTSRCV